MSTLLTAGTDVATVVLFDPRAMANRISTNPEEWYDKIRADGASANALVYLPGADGEYRFELFVDEELSPERKHHTKLYTGHLKVPSGTLLFLGAEEIEAQRLALLPPDAGIDLAVGGYDVEVYDPIYGPTPEEQARFDTVLANARRDEPLGYRLNQLRWALFGMTLLPLTTVFAIILLLIAWREGALGDLFRSNLRFAFYAVPLVWATFFGIGRIPAVRRYSAATNEENDPTYDEELAPIAIVLRRRSEPPEVWKGICFGE